MIEAWNKGSGEGFAAPFTERADCVAFEGTHLKGRQKIASFHQQLFDTSVKGSRLDGEVKFVRLLSPHLAVMHAVVRVTLPGQTDSSPSRDSMQIFVVAKRDEGWRAEGLLNARRLTAD
ncbi:MAG: SgcJ/EcaC family oxidoreductase [Blastocatellia bacterium]